VTDRPMNWEAAGGFLLQEAKDNRRSASTVKDAPLLRLQLSVTAEICEALGRALIFGATGKDRGK